MSTKLPLSDSQILESSQDTPWMFEMLVERYQEAFLRKASYILGRDSAEDAVQDTFIKIYKYASRFSERRGSSFSSWAYKILVNTCYSYSARKSLEAGRTKAVEMSSMDEMGTADNAIGNEQASFVQSVLTRLPAGLSRLLSLHFFEGKNYEEIAASENLSLSAVKSRLHRAKKQFKDVAIEVI